MPFDLVDEIESGEREWLEDGLDKEDHPLMTKWQYRDCPKCLTPFSITQNPRNNKWRCSHCGRHFKVEVKKRNQAI